uniref:Uncharacterized protein n=1 Tax=Anguilla anguilla TaxID=7936 RepID=A0A0E9XHV9_ANGAN
MSPCPYTLLISCLAYPKQSSETHSYMYSTDYYCHSGLWACNDANCNTC